MAIDRRFTNATSSNSGLTGIENFYNSYNKVQSDSVILQTMNGESITLTHILKDSAKHKDFQALTKEDFIDGVLPSENGKIDEENFTHLLSLIKCETTTTAPKLVVNGQLEEIERNVFRTQTVFLRINNSNQTIKLRDILKKDVKNKPLQEITLEDIEDEFVPEKATKPNDYEPLVKLINGETLDADDKVIITYNDKTVDLDHDTYVQEGVATDTTLKVGESATSSAKREYYTATSAGIDKTPRYVDSKQIIPPAYKKTNDTDKSHINNAQNMSNILAGRQIAVDGVISYRKEDGTIGYRKNQEVAMLDGELYAVPEGYQVDVSRLSTADQANHIAKRVKLGELKSSNVVGNLSGIVEKKFNVAHNKYTIDFGNVKRTINFYDNHFVIENGSDEVVFGNEDYFKTASGITTRTTFRVKSFSHSYDPATNGFRLDIAFVDNFIKNSNPATANPTSDEQLSSKLVADNSGNITQIKSVLSAGGVEQTMSLNNVFGLNFNVKCDKSFVGNFDCFKPAPLFTPKRDASGNVVYKKDAKGNTINDVNGQPVAEQEINADFLQTTKTDDNGELSTFDFAENDRLVREFEEEVLKLQEEIVKLKEDNTNDQNIQAIKDLKQKLDEKLEKIKNIRNKTSIKSVNKIIEEYQNGEFFDTFFFDENGEMFEIKDGKKVALSSNSSADYNNLMDDLIGKYTVKNNKGKCQVVFGETATNIIGGSLKVAETLYSLSLAPGLLSLVALPFALTIGTGAIAFAGGTAVFNLVRNKIKQAQLNSLTPEKLKKRLDEKCKSATKEDIKKATKEYNHQVKRIKENTLDEEKKNKLLDQAKEQFLTKRAQIIGRLSTLDDITIQSKFSVKDKKITLANIYGRAEWKQQQKNIKKGSKPDFNAKHARQEAERKYKQEYDTKLVALPKNAKFAAEKAKLKKQYKIAVEDAINEYYAQNGPTRGARSRLHYLKKTLAYLNADDATRLQMEKDCREAMKKAPEIKEVESTTLMSKNSNAIRGKLIKYIEANSPKGVPITTEESAILLNLEEKHTKQVKDREHATTYKTQAEKDYNNVAGFVTAVENSAEFIADKENNNDHEQINGQELLQGIKNETTGKAQKIKTHKEQGKDAKYQKNKQEREELDKRKAEAKEYNDSLIESVFASGPIKDIADKGDLEVYARTWYRDNNLYIGTPDEEKVSTFLDEMATQDENGIDTYLRMLEKSGYFKSSYNEIKTEQNDVMIGELMAKDNEFMTLIDKNVLNIMAKIYVKMKKNHGQNIPKPRFAIPKKDASGNKIMTPQYMQTEIQEIFLKDLTNLDIVKAKHLMDLLRKQKEYQDYIAKTASAGTVTP